MIFLRAPLVPIERGRCLGVGLDRAKQVRKAHDTGCRGGGVQGGRVYKGGTWGGDFVPTIVSFPNIDTSHLQHANSVYN